ncbi:transglycosylase SLT domain-containing protein [Chloroflexota bacterium]
MIDQKKGYSVWIILGILAILGAIMSLFIFRDEFKTPERLYSEAQDANPGRALQLYNRLADELPQLSTFSRLWAAGKNPPDPQIMNDLRAITALYPQSLEAYHAYLDIARLNAVQKPQLAESAYRQALRLNDSSALRLELAQFLEENGDLDKAILEYRALLSDVPDAFVGMRRTGHDPIKLAGRLIDATYFSDALEVLHNSIDPAAVPLTAQAHFGLAQYEEAETAYALWLENDPNNAEALFGLARTYVQLGNIAEAKLIYEQIDTSDSLLEIARLLEWEEPEKAIAIYLESPYPVAWWNATWLLEEEGRPEEALPLYHEIAQADTYFSDDAAYRLLILGGKLDDEQAVKDARSILETMDKNWLGLRASELSVGIDLNNKFAPVGPEIFGKVRALETIGREDLAEDELLFTSQHSDDPIIKSNFLKRLAAGESVLAAQTIAETYLASNPEGSVEFWHLSFPQPYQDIVMSAADEFGLDPLLIWSVMRVESRFDPDAISLANARGLMQIIPSTQDWIAEQLDIELEPGDAYRPEINIRLGSWYLGYLLDYFKGDLELSILAYNGGFTNVESWQDDPLVRDREDLLRWIGFGETREYLQRVMLDYLVYQELYGEE